MGLIGLAESLSLKPEELLLHQELDVLFDNNNHFTLEEAVVSVRNRPFGSSDF